MSAFFRREGKRLAADAVRFYEARKDVGDEFEVDLSTWMALVNPFALELREQFMSAVNEFIESGINLDPADMIVMDQAAMEFAQERAAEMVGMRLVDGELIVNPNPKWAITDTTRLELRRLVENAFENGRTPAELANDIRDSTAFSKARATMIARTELAFAHVAGGIESAIAAGMTHKRLIINPDSPTAPTDECGESAQEGAIPIGESFASGDYGPPLHPHCVCSLVFTNQAAIYD